MIKLDLHPSASQVQIDQMDLKVSAALTQMPTSKAIIQPVEFYTCNCNVFLFHNTSDLVLPH